MLCPIRSIDCPLFPRNSPSIKIFTFTENHATELKRGNPERTSVNTDIWSWTMADIWSEKNVGSIGPVKFLSDLTVGPTYFGKSALLSHCVCCLIPGSRHMHFSNQHGCRPWTRLNVELADGLQPAVYKIRTTGSESKNRFPFTFISNFQIWIGIWSHFKF